MLEFYRERQLDSPIPPTKSNLKAMLRSGKGWALVRIPQLKNDQLMDKGFPPVVLTLHQGAICPLRDLLLMEIESPMPDLAERQQTPLFVDPETGKQLTKTALGTVFKSLVKRTCSLRGDRNYTDQEIAKVWSLHSFRITGQNWLRAAGAEPWEIKLAGRWLSDCYQKYTRADLMRLGQLGTNLRKDTAPVANLPGLTAYPYQSRTISPALPSPGRDRTAGGVGEFTLTAAEAQEATRAGEEDHRGMTPTERQRFASLVTCSPNPKSLVGRKVRKCFDGKWYSGEVSAEDNRAEDLFVLVNYEDGDHEAIHVAEISEFLAPEGME